MRLYLLVAALACLPTGSLSAQVRSTKPCPGDETTAGMRRCLNAQLHEADSLMAVALTDARARSMNPALVDTAQTAWVEYRRTHCRAVASEYEGGSLQGVLLTTCLRDVTRERLRTLDAMFRQP